MPELPEVEIIKRGLESKIIGKTIAELEVRAEKIFKGEKADVVDGKITQIVRHAKMIEIDLSNGNSLLIHLKMTGQLVYDEKPGDKSNRIAGGHPSFDWVADLPNKFTHVIFKFTDGSVLFFNDLRKFGYIKVFPTNKILAIKEISELGPDPFTDKLNSDYLMKIISRRPNLKVKQLIMDQSVVAGVGNIYADESLFCAGISPLRQNKYLSQADLDKLIECIRKVIKKGLDFGGSSENTFVNVEGGKGDMQNHFMIYRKTGKDCPNKCGKVKRVVVGGRGTHYCPICQK